MALSTSHDTQNFIAGTETLFEAEFPAQSNLETIEQKRRFELLRLAFFVLKLRKLEQRITNATQEYADEPDEEQLFRCNLLRHAIFQQVVTLIALDAREQAMQIIDACKR